MTADPSEGPRVLVIAEAANPEMVSVPLVGWSLANALSSVARVHLVTQIRNRDAILKTGLQEGVDFTAIDSEAIARPMWKLSNILRMDPGKAWTTLAAINALTYPYFEKLFWSQFGALIAGGQYDLVHRVTPLSPTATSPLAKKCRRHGVPFVLGPLNGGVPWPPGFEQERQAEREWLSYVRGAYKALPGRKATLEAASAIIVGSMHTKSEIPSDHQKKTFWLPENAVDPARLPSKGTAPRTGPLKGCFLGRCVPYKGPDMLLDAARPMLEEHTLELDFIGDGPMLPQLQEMVAAWALQDRVRFHGWQEHQSALRIAQDCDLLTFPSIREFGGGVVLEAMAMGLVPLIVDYAGPGELVIEGLGFKVPIGPRDSIVSALGAKLREIVADPSELPAIGKRAQAHVEEHFTWPAKARQVREIYDWTLGRREARPQVAFQPVQTVGSEGSEAA